MALIAVGDPESPLEKRFLRWLDRNAVATECETQNCLSHKGSGAGSAEHLDIGKGFTRDEN
ncbi:hypothetical protein FHS85_002811 [Rhodoligotrophos appendicifer]